MIVIHNFPRGARGVRLFWQCEEMGLPYRAETVTFPPGADYLALNPLGNVPFLQDGAVAIHESVAIMLYLAQKYGPTPLLPEKDDPALATVLQLLVFSEASFGAGMNALMVAHFGAPAEHKRNWSVAAQEGIATKQLDFIAAKLGSNPYLAGDTFTLADIAVVTALGIWKGALNKDIPPSLAEWRARLGERQASQRAQKAQAA